MSESSGEKIKLNDVSTSSADYKNTGTFDDAAYAPESDEKTLTDSDHLSDEEAERWRRATIRVSLVTIIFLTVLGIGFIAISIVTGSSAALGLAFDMMLDSVTSMVVLWRYFKKDTVYVKEKEHRAVICLALLFLLFAMIITIKCVIAIVTHTSPSQEIVLAGVSAISVVTMTTLAAIKFVIARKLNSKSIYSDAFSSAMGALISFGIILGAIIYVNLEVTIIDSIIGLIVAVMLAIWGMCILVNEIRKLV
ncbi:transmembrane protein 163a-like [Glandiceps talaboti]